MHFKRQVVVRTGSVLSQCVQCGNWEGTTLRWFAWEQDLSSLLNGNDRVRVSFSVSMYMVCPMYSGLGRDCLKNISWPSLAKLINIMSSNSSGFLIKLAKFETNANSARSQALYVLAVSWKAMQCSFVFFVFFCCFLFFCFFVVFFCCFFLSVFFSSNCVHHENTPI